MRGLKALFAVSGFALAMVVASHASAGQVVINFDDLGDGVVVTNQYPTATFQSDPGEQVLTLGEGALFGTSAPNFICTGASGSFDCAHDVFVTFTNPVNGLSFRSTGADNVGQVANVHVFDVDGFAGSVAVQGVGKPFTAQLVDLSAFKNVIGIEIDQVTDPNGLGYDDFTFTVGGAVPEPATWAMLILGLGLVGFAARRRGAGAALAA